MAFALQKTECRGGGVVLRGEQQSKGRRDWNETEGVVETCRRWLECMLRKTKEDMSFFENGWRLRGVSECL